MQRASSLFGTVFALVGLGLFVYGLLRGLRIYTYVGLSLLVLGIVGSCKKLLCPNCGKRAWASGRRITHCQACGARYAGED